MTLMAVGKRSRSSASPSCLPALENGGQGTPPATRSIPFRCETSCVFRSPSTTFQPGRLRRNVEQAALSTSTSSTWPNPAVSRPRACPPPPEQISSDVKLFTFDSHFVATNHYISGLIATKDTAIKRFLPMLAHANPRPTGGCAPDWRPEPSASDRSDGFRRKYEVVYTRSLRAKIRNPVWATMRSSGRRRSGTGL